MIYMIFLPFQMKGKKVQSLFEGGNLLQVIKLIKIRQWEAKSPFPAGGIEFSPFYQGREKYKKDP